MFRPLSTSSRRIAALLFSFCIVGLAWGDDHHSLWAVKGKQNTVYFLGSIHLLRANESMPKEAEEAYRSAGKVVMEIDLDDLDPMAAQQSMLKLGMLPPGQTLAGELGPEAAAKAEAKVKELGMSLAALSQFRPWFAAITLTQLHLLKLGFDPQSGVEQRFMTKATADHKEILGLETLDEQFGLLAGFPTKLQTQFLLQSLEEAGDAEHEVDEMISAWRTGDADALEKFVNKAMQEFPELYGPLTVDRNKRWLGRLQQFLAAKENYLVIVGALHLVGKDGVLDLLAHKGYRIEQL